MSGGTAQRSAFGAPVFQHASVARDPCRHPSLRHGCLSHVVL